MSFMSRMKAGEFLILRKVYVGMIVGKYYEVKDGAPDYQKIEEHIRLAEQYAIKLWNEGFAVFTPHLNTRHFEIKTKVPEAIYQDFYQHMLKIADFIFVLPNWRESKNGRKEIKMAIKLGIPVFDKISELKKWRAKKKFETVKI